MIFRSWSEVDKILAEKTDLATPEQRRLGDLADKSIPPSTPKIIAAALLRIAYAEELDLPSPRPGCDRYEERLQSLHRPSDPPVLIQTGTEEEEEAWVRYLRFVRRRESLFRLKLNSGDIVQTKYEQIVEVSSIDQDGRVFFKGGKGFRSWPDLLSVVARKNEKSSTAIEARRQAENFAARRSTSSGWSEAKHEDLAEFATKDVVSEDDITELESIITRAKDERPIQKFLEDNAHVLTSLLTGNDRYCLPQKRLGSEYIPDFIIGDVDSLGIRWILVELETPRSGIYLKKGLELDKEARKGINQITHWRDWIANNIAYAHQRRSEDGLGLFDIRERTEAIVLVGRKALMPRTKDAVRRTHRQSEDIHIHTYDWLIRTLHGVVQHSGPPALNRQLIPRKKQTPYWDWSE